MSIEISEKSRLFDTGSSSGAKNVKVERKNAPDEGKACQVRHFNRPTPNLFPDNICQTDEEIKGGYIQAILKTEVVGDKGEGTSKKRTSIGLKPHPFNFRAMTAFKNHNVHHSAAIDAKVQTSVGLGHEKDKIADKLDPLCSVSWSAVRQAGAEDFWQVGNWWIEVVWDGPERKKILGLHPVMSCDVRIYIENHETKEYHWVVHSPEGEQHYAAWGDLRDFVKRRGEASAGSIGRAVPNAELIHIPDPSAASRWYGMPNHLAAVSTIELVQALMQYQFDFHRNRGVPEFMLFITGGKVSKDDWKKITDSIDSQIGVGNSHKSLAVNLTDQDLKVQLEKLAMEGTTDGSYFKDMMEALALNVVSAHRVPPSLAGILIPGKMGAANEMSNAVLAFQILVIGPAQETIEAVLNKTLGDPKMNGGLGLSRGDFTFKTVTDEMAEEMKKLQPADTMGRMKQGLPESAAEGRDLEKGTKERGNDEQRVAVEKAQMIAMVLKAMDKVAA